MKEEPALKKVKVSVKLPFLDIESEWEADLTERKAAWSLYVELVTRITIETLKEDEGLLREALNSLYSLFGTTREILKEAGPNVGASSTKSVGGIAIAVLNRRIRPFLTKWHPRLEVWEAKCPPNVSFFEYEQQWSEALQLRNELQKLRSDLKYYAAALGKIANVEN